MEEYNLQDDASYQHDQEEWGIVIDRTEAEEQSDKD